MGSKSRTMLKLALGLIFSLAAVQAYHYHVPYLVYPAYGYTLTYLPRYTTTTYYGKRAAEAEPEAEADAYYRGFESDETSYVLGLIPVILSMNQVQTDPRMENSYSSNFNENNQQRQEMMSYLSYFNNGVRQFQNDEKSQSGFMSGDNQFNFGYKTQTPSQFEYSVNQQEKFPQSSDSYRNDYNGNPSGFINRNPPQQQFGFNGEVASGQNFNEEPYTFNSYYGAARQNGYHQQAANNHNQHLNPPVEKKVYSSIGFNPKETKRPSFRPNQRPNPGLTSIVDLRTNDEDEQSRPNTYRAIEHQNQQANNPRGFKANQTKNPKNGLQNVEGEKEQLPVEE